MKGAGALVSGMLILAAVCALPAVSAAQDAGSPAVTTTTTSDPLAPTTPDPPATPAPEQQPTTPADNGNRSGGGNAGAGSQSESVASAPSPAATNRPASVAHTSSTTSVSMQDFLFSPASVTVHVGDLVTWHNAGKQPHTATADDGSFDTGTVVAGQSASHEFTQAGTFTYVCTIHPNMKGTVRVLSASGSGGGAGGSSSSGSANSEASAVASPDAAGNSNTLPMTGMAVGALALVGLALLASGLVFRYSARKSAADGAGRQLSLF